MGTLATVGVIACGSEPAPHGADPTGAWEIDSVPHLAVGGHDERPAFLLDQVAGATLMSDGRLVILDRGSAELRFFDRAGAHLKTVGGEGDGPGELRFPFQLVRTPADTLIVLGVRSGLSWFGPTGEYVRQERADLFSIGDDPCRFGEGFLQGLPDGSVLVLLEDNFAPTYCPPQPVGIWRMTGLVGRQRFGPSLDFDTLAFLPATERNGDNYRVFGHSLALAVGDDRIFAGDTNAEVILTLSFQGDTLAILPIPNEPRPISARARSQRTHEWLRDDGVVERGQPFDYPSAYPRFAQLLVDAVGHLWIKSYPEALEPVFAPRLTYPQGGYVATGGSTWTVVDRSGQVVQRLQTPADLFVTEVGEDYILGVSRDELGVETVRVHRLSRRAGDSF